MKKVYKPFFEAVVANPWDQQYQALIKEFLSLKDPGTTARAGTSSAINEKSIVRNGVEWTISFHKPDSKWGNTWNFMGIFAMRTSDRKHAYDTPELQQFEKADMSKLKNDDPVMSTFMKNKGHIYAKDHPETQAWQKKNYELFKDAIQYIKTWNLSKSKIFN